MARFNKQSVGTKTVNLAGGEAFTETPKLEFASILLTSFAQDKFYRSADDEMARVTALIAAIPDKQFVAKAAIYARTVFGMRSITHVVAAELAQHIRGQRWAKSFFEKVIYRPDDILETMAYYAEKYGKPWPNAMKKGFAARLSRFSPYQLAKYRGEGKALSLVDVCNIVHPKPTETNAEAFKALMTGDLKSEDTWESQLTRAGQEAETDEEKAELKGAAWKTLIAEGKLGYFAALRNIRNVMEQAPEALDGLLAILTDEERIKKSMVLPFRYLTAIAEIEKVSGGDTRRVLIALSNALDIAVQNVPKFEGRTLIVLDVSGSMQPSYNPNVAPEKSPIAIGALFAAALYKSNDADVIAFGQRAEYVNMNPLDTTLTLANRLAHLNLGGTDFRCIFNTANRPYDRIVLLTDMQAWIGYHAPIREYAEYKQRCNCNPHVFCFDLAGYGTLQFPERNVYCLAGFSEKAFDIMALLEQNKGALIAEIEKVEL